MSIKQLLLAMSFGLFIVIIAGCSNHKEKQPIEDQSSTSSENEQEDEPENKEQTDLPLSDFFLPDGTTASFKGEGNEFAELTLEVHHLDDQHIAIDEDNGGSLVRRVYKIENNRILVISEQIIDYEDPLPSVESLAGLSTQYIYLEKPIRKGHSFAGWTIADVNSKVKTPFKTFDNAIKLEMIDHGFTNIIYIVPEYGEVLRESIMEQDGDDFVITSSLKSIEENKQ